MRTAAKYFNVLKDRFGEGVVSQSSFRGDECVRVRREIWIEACSFLKNDQGFSMLIDLCAVDRKDLKGLEPHEGIGDRFEVVAHLYGMDGGERIRIKTQCPDGGAIPTLTGLYRAANWFEREAFDLFGVRFDGHPNLKRILCHHEFEGHPLRKDYPKDGRGGIPTPDTLLDEMGTEPALEGKSRDVDERRMYLNIGPSHPAMHGCFRVLVELDGERIVKAVPEIGYLHRCFEKEAEAHPWHAVIPYTDRLNYVSPLMNNVGYCMAVEKLLGISIPERAQWIRMLVCEVSRIADHLVSIGANLVDVGALTNFWYLFNVRESFVDWVESLCGARLTANYARIGGISRDLPTDTVVRLKGCVGELRRAIRHVLGLIRRNRIFLDRTQGIGGISKDDAIDYGFTGPCLRAAGVDYDVRRAHPYYHYGGIEWDVPVGSNGDTYDRIFVRMEEMEQSVRMIGQILERMPAGPILADRPDVVLPTPGEVYGSIEGMMRQFKIVMDGISVPEGEVYSYTEAANGELGFYVVSDGGPNPYRIKVRPPCFAIYQAYPKLVEGHMIADAIAIMGSLNIIAGELDR